MTDELDVIERALQTAACDVLDVDCPPDGPMESLVWIPDLNAAIAALPAIRQALALAEQQQVENERLKREMGELARYAKEVKDAILPLDLRDSEWIPSAIKRAVAELSTAQAEAARLREALTMLVGIILRREQSLRSGSQTAAVSIVSKAQEMRHHFALSDAAAPAKQDTPHAPTEAEAADLGRPEEEAC